MPNDLAFMLFPKEAVAIAMLFYNGVEVLGLTTPS